MLKKLLKYEFQATGRTFGGVYLGLVAVALMLGVAMRFALPGEAMFNETTVPVNSGIGIAMAILSIVYFALVVATGVLTVVTIIERFRKNLLGGEGYLMHTLPVSAKTLIASKLIAGELWSLASLLAILLSGLLMVCVMTLGTPVFSANENLADFFVSAQQEFGQPLVLMIMGLLIAAAAAIACSTLLIYAVIMLAHQVKKYPVPAGILAFIVLANAQSLLTALLGFGGIKLVEVSTTASSVGGSLTAALNALPTAGQFWLDVAVTALPCIVFAALYFCLADWLMKKHLNLE
ncbi:MAG: hypothetical protein LKJ90_08035 [Faecalibacterium sp.]|jgi:hypothetical protein|nr:hypothetical protein [Faecalibacterium sp.]